MKISFVIPCYGSEKTILMVVDEVIETVEKLGSYDYEIILSEDASPDNVWTVIQGLCEQNHKIKGIKMAKNFGQHSALLAGYSQCTGDLIVSLDDDGQSPIDELNLLLDKLNEGFCVVYGIYKEIKQTAFRRFGTFMAQKMGVRMIQQPKGIIETSYFVARRFIIDEMLKYEHSFPYLPSLVFRITQNVANVQTHQRERLDGKSGYTLHSLFALWLNGFTAFSILPLRVSSFIGFICSILGFIAVIVTVIRKLIDTNVNVGWSSIFALILFIGGLIMLMLGMIGEYLGRVYIGINHSPQYVIMDSINAEN
ncbi:MAG: glycosyltransferase family 2 protein [Eggerthellaceae bacterium]|nr:glycosyltransferase family 2 protein [Eggerthellaceae bacterium]